MNTLQRITAFLLGLVTAAVGTSAAAQELQRLEDDVVQAVEKTRPSVVIITTTYADATEEPEPGADTATIAGRPTGTFSGVVYDTLGHIVTVASAVEDAREIHVGVADGTAREAKIVGVDWRTNLAVLSVDPKGLLPLTMAPADRLRVGSFAIGVGNAFGLEGTITLGVLSGKDRTVQSGERLMVGLLQTTTPVNPGDAGGALINSRGELVGIIASTFQRAPAMANMEKFFDQVTRDLNSNDFLTKAIKDLGDIQKDLAGLPEGQRQAELMKRMMEQFIKHPGSGERKPSGRSVWRLGRAMQSGMLGAEGINFAVPVDTVQTIVPQLITHRRVDRAWLGILLQPVDAPVRVHLELPQGIGVLVSRVVPGAPAAAGGLNAWDVLLDVDGRPLHSLADVERIVASRPPGTELKFNVIRRGEKKLIAVTLGKAPDDDVVEPLRRPETAAPEKPDPPPANPQPPPKNE